MSVRNSEMEKLSRKLSADAAEDLETPESAENQDELAEDDVSSDEFNDTIALEAESETSDNVGYSSVQIDVGQLLAEVEAEAIKGVDRSGRIRRRLEAIVERKRRHQDLLDFDDYDLDS